MTLRTLLATTALVFMIGGVADSLTHADARTA